MATKFFKVLSLSIILLITQTRHIQAVYDPLTHENNIFGIHISNEGDLEDAAKLVNSSGGEWGYVTIVIRQDERIEARWQTAFDKMRELKLVPIVRIATSMNPDGSWSRPRMHEAEVWGDFLGKLNWPIKNRYVVLFNEPNHAKEWGGRIDPTAYAQMAAFYARALRARSQDFFILPAGLDQAAPNGVETMDELMFLRKMYEQDSGIFSIFDGWTSHSYPNPGFSGSINDTGRASIRGYHWELEQIESMGAGADLPVFITETGWVHTSDINLMKQNYEVAFSQVWDDPQVVAITPFILNFQAGPFSKFSWKDPRTGGFLPFYKKVQSLSKTKGEPQMPKTEKAEKEGPPAHSPQSLAGIIILTNPLLWPVI